IIAVKNTGTKGGAMGNIHPETSGKRLIVLPAGSFLLQIETGISTLDVQGDQGSRELQTVELKNATAPELLPTVNRIYSEQNQGKTTKPASIYADSSGGRLMVYGTKEQGAAIRQIVDTLERQNR